MFPKDLVIEINKMLNNDQGENYPAILRMTTPLVDLKLEAYISQFLSLGPHHHSKLEKYIKYSCGDRCKISRVEEKKRKDRGHVSQNLC